MRRVAQALALSTALAISCNLANQYEPMRFVIATLSVDSIGNGAWLASTAAGAGALLLAQHCSLYSAAWQEQPAATDKETYLDR